MIRVLLVDDSDVSLMVLREILEKEPDIFVVGKAKSGKEAVYLASRVSPDIITMDINMPDMDGFTTTRQIMERTPVPIIIVSGIDNLEEIRASFRAVEAGALAVFRKPPALNDPGYENAAQELVYAVKTFSEVKVIKRRTNNLVLQKETDNSLSIPIQISRQIRAIVIGASTGGPQVIQEILKNIPGKLSLPLVMVQHMSPGFIEGLALWLNDSTGFPVRIAKEGEQAQPGTLYLAPDKKHTGITADLRFTLSSSQPEHNLRPSVSYLFRSAAKNLGPYVIGILLSGMGSDGAEELLQIRQGGGCTIIQDKESSFVYGMPGAAELINAGQFSLSPSEIASFLNQYLIGGMSDGN
ncbi:chemotaxis-specific protein-glutamate methyltransferase CheB [Methanospirillum sp.]|jgi:two-component system chemotaxis response regulator CheB|uniref:chemotaxis-specific protein-glutamate methyltransferase CheB n=1 Tax=Methanospirillum sp. TaxID=45200 RepID=UPI001BD35894|nr:chemotaxis-specific protein-glutamate methyltransferase CheB [Methanospirillum sp.]